MGTGFTTAAQGQTIEAAVIGMCNRANQNCLMNADISRGAEIDDLSVNDRNSPDRRGLRALAVDALISTCHASGWASRSCRPQRESAHTNSQVANETRCSLQGALKGWMNISSAIQNRVLQNMRNRNRSLQATQETSSAAVPKATSFL